ncbi:Eco57I restriction-modification methylase domain-containing protein [Ureaplasma parvum]|uniref:Eco57I restriction-modification methylase domain-containing protein n=1 Tax=Ureaplasma parvum TaxID=134821 RepID=UPI0004565768|nr:hypothetical protein [Ureaplasma parvum]BAO73569.1 putative uncharacterized protein [Ureaplasma parvum serovar 3]
MKKDIKANEQKIKLGQFFTRQKFWLKPQIIDFILNSKCSIAYDPFAGAGNLINISKLYGINKIIGLDIDNHLGWEWNDSLLKIPSINNAIIITNPPYLAKHSATRKKIDLSKYFNNSIYDDLYLIALERMIEAQKYIVAIIPESFVNSSFKNKDLLSSITILEENPFDDTHTPICVACFDGIPKTYDKIKIYKNNNYINTLSFLQSLKISPKKTMKILFNDLHGWLGIRAIDGTDDKKSIHFDFKEKIPYNWQTKIKRSSRHYTLINIDIKQRNRESFINKCNSILQELRNKSADTILTPFMGNTKSGIRRRRMDFKLARAIMEQAFDYFYK